MKQGTMDNHDEMIGARFGRWTVVKETEPYIYKGKPKHKRYLCLCDCGNTKEVSKNVLRCGKSKSCGCWNREKPSNNIKHHMSETRIYYKYKGMKSRCLYPKCESYKYYGGRGIRICDEWNGEEGFNHFLRWSMDNGYDENMSLDRIDVDGDYSPSNCRWIPFREQAHNKRNTIYKDGESVAKLARERGIVQPHIARERIKNGWSLEDAISIPLMKKGQRLETTKATNV